MFVVLVVVVLAAALLLVRAFEELASNSAARVGELAARPEVGRLEVCCWLVTLDNEACCC